MGSNISVTYEVAPLCQQRKDYFYEFMSDSKHRFFRRQAFCLPFQKIVSKDAIVPDHVNRHQRNDSSEITVLLFDILLVPPETSGNFHKRL